jgi:DNA-binding NarL/FixJ family response regulator
VRVSVQCLNQIMKKLSAKKYQFTARENDVAKLVAKGTSRKIMCDKLNIKISTLARHLVNIRLKIGADSLYAAGCILSHYY